MGKKDKFMGSHKCCADIKSVKATELHGSDSLLMYQQAVRWAAVQHSLSVRLI